MKTHNKSNILKLSANTKLKSKLENSMVDYITSNPQTLMKTKLQM